jgi:superfamily II DNA or RNA helicase
MDKNNMNTYLGIRGYTIPKNEISIESQIKIRNDLTIKPFIPGAPVTNINDYNSFPAYRESSNKFYVPHYYGIENYGNPKQYKISEGLDINLTFNGKPRDYQEPVIQKFLNHCEKVKYGGGLLELHTAWGKTSASLYISTQLKKKTIVIVHKEFLMNQWIERIQHFLPGARIGKIQGPIVDTKDKDIVLCMLQSLITKDYEQSIFDEFGLTIIDEVHHISSRTFSTSLFKVVTKYMLGLSATMERKDGTTDVFKMFLGDVIHKAERKNENIVEVRAITYKSNDDNFNEIIYDYRGNPQISSMISKLCEYNRRTEFIVKTIVDHISVENIDKNIINACKENMDKNNPNCKMCNNNINYLVKNNCCGCVKYCLPCVKSIQPTIVSITGEDGKIKKTKIGPKCPECHKGLKYEQNYIENPHIKPINEVHTIIMSHNLNILNYIYEKFVCKNLASVGFYVGGMKEKELKESEKKHIILATYSMCSEGLDIPSLTTEFLITPKTDVVQIVGRILRAKHPITTPTIYDFIDTHDNFQKQWLKRKSYYKKQNYRIIGIDNINYLLRDIDRDRDWKVINQFKEMNDDKQKTVKSTNKKSKTEKSNSSTDKSIINDDSDSSDNESDNEINDKPKDKYLCGKCLLPIKKI